MDTQQVKSVFSPTSARVLPFAFFMAFILIKEVYSFFLGSLSVPLFVALYFIQIMLVAAALVLLRKHYLEISFKDLFVSRHTLTSLVVAVLVFFLWISRVQEFLIFKSIDTFNPLSIHSHSWRMTFFVVRCIAAVIIVPFMEEIFWRSFLLRYMVNVDFSSVAIGIYTTFSFVSVALLFGLEHSFIVSGIIAGLSYNTLLYYTKSLSQCIFSHSVTNLLLSIYVIFTGSWQFW